MIYGKCGCGKDGYHKHSMKEVINGVYQLKGENYLDPRNKVMSEGFWSAGQPKKKNFGSKYGGKRY